MQDFMIENGTLIKYSGSERRVTVPVGVTAIGDRAFIYCRSMERIILPETVSRIGSYAFARCSALRDVSIPKTVTHIGRYAFFGCHSLTCVTLPDSVDVLGDYAFSSCRGLKVLYMEPLLLLDLIGRQYDCGVLASAIRGVFTRYCSDEPYMAEICHFAVKNLEMLFPHIGGEPLFYRRLVQCHAIDRDTAEELLERITDVECRAELIGYRSGEDDVGERFEI